ncbi:MAG: NHL repeat-containing protein [Planctomycetota bacterium]|jgi:hypothetical protein
MFGGVATAGSNRVVFATADGSVVFLDVESGKVESQFALHPSAPERVQISACAVHSDGTILLADVLHQCVRRFGRDGRQLGRYGGISMPGPGVPHDDAGILDEPCALLTMDDGGLLVACGGFEVENGVQRLDAEGNYRSSLARPEGGWLSVQGLARVGDTIWVAETEGGAIHRYRSDGSNLDRLEMPEELQQPLRMQFDGYEAVLALFAPRTKEEQEIFGIARLDLDGSFDSWVVEGGEDSGRVYCPFDLAVLADGRFVVADLPLGEPPDVRLQLFSADGRLLNTLFEDPVDLSSALKAWFESMLASGDEGPETLYQQARIHHFHAGMDRSNLLAARDLYRAAIERDPHLLLARLGLGALLQQGLDAPEEAESEHRMAIGEGGDEGELQARIAECRAARGDLDAAISLLKEAVEGEHPPEEYHRRVEELGTWYLERAGETP